MGWETDGVIAELYRKEWGRLLAALIPLTGDFGLAEDALQEAFGAALERWREAGAPAYPEAWLFRTARNKAIDRMRRGARWEMAMEGVAEPAVEPLAPEEEAIPDERLRLMFTCCDPALPLEAQVALTLRTLGGLTTEEIARAFLIAPQAMAQRLVRAQARLREAGVRYRVPDAEELPARKDAVLGVIYLIFNEGYAASGGEEWVRGELCAEAIRLGRLARELMPEDTETAGLLALMLLHDARREARVDERGDLVLLEDQDRAKWNRAQIDEGLAVAGGALRGGVGPYAVQAAVAALHCVAARAEDTDWAGIAHLYEVLERLQPTAVVRLNRAAAVGMAEGPGRGLELIAEVEGLEGMESYHVLHAAKADLLRRAGDYARAAQAYERALELARNAGERRFLEKRLAEVRLV
jgi:RNA polymerase sigma-70 factor (ECF subfamily)